MQQEKETGWEGSNQGAHCALGTGAEGSSSIKSDMLLSSCPGQGSTAALRPLAERQLS